MKQFLLIILFWVVIYPLYSQIYTCNFTGTCVAPPPSSLGTGSRELKHATCSEKGRLKKLDATFWDAETKETKEEIEKMMDTIVAITKKDLGTTYDYEIFPSSESKIADCEGGDTTKPRILYNQEIFVIAKHLFGKEAKWAVYGIFAHEYAHICLQHFVTYNRIQKTPYQIELEADWRAGKILQKLGADHHNAQHTFLALRHIPEADLCYHPRRSLRQEALLKGWRNAGGNLEWSMACRYEPVPFVEGQKDFMIWEWFHKLIVKEEYVSSNSTQEQSQNGYAAMFNFFGAMHFNILGSSNELEKSYLGQCIPFYTNADKYGNYIGVNIEAGDMVDADKDKNGYWLHKETGSIIKDNSPHAILFNIRGFYFLDTTFLDKGESKGYRILHDNEDGSKVIYDEMLTLNADRSIKSDSSLIFQMRNNLYVEADDDFEIMRFIDTKGKEIPTLTQTFGGKQYLGFYNEDLILLQNSSGKDTCFLINREGKLIETITKGSKLAYRYFLPPNSKNLYPIQDKTTELWGAINDKKQLLIPYRFEESFFFEEERAMVKDTTGKIGYIDIEGKVIVPLVYETCGFIVENKVKVEGKEGWGFYDIAAQKEITPLTYEKVFDFREGRAAIQDTSGKWGYIDEFGKQIISCKYEEATSFSNGIARVKLQDSYYKEKYHIFLIDKTGKCVYGDYGDCPKN